MTYGYKPNLYETQIFVAILSLPSSRPAAKKCF